MLVSVDDIVLTGNSSQLLDKVVSDLNAQFALKNLGQLHYFLGIEVTHTETCMQLNQHKYALDLLLKTHIQNCNPCTTPLVVGSKLSLEDSHFFDQPPVYKSVIRAVQYLTLTRPDLSYTVNKLSQYLKAPTINHW